MNKIITGISVLALVAVATFGATQAFFTSDAEANGVTINSGDLDLMLNLDEAGGGWSNSFSPSETPGYGDLSPGGDTANFSAQLQNDGSTDAAAIGLAVDHTTNDSNIAAQMRITELTWKDENLLEGGAGANIGEYTAPTNCDVTVTSSESIQTDGIDNVSSSDDTVCVGGGTYNEDLTVNEDITLAALNAPDSTNRATIEGRIDVNSNDVTIQGFEITNPDAGYGVVFDGVTGGVVDHNVFTDIGSDLLSGYRASMFI
ncbi:MAG: hypothetical protein U5L75_02870 [Candidatus Campbellbacteria bacterium]|nr:hypothetical protein [Candidatus Campbellbacteria bacterium]